MKEITAAISAEISRIEGAIMRAHGVLLGAPWVIECVKGLYLVVADSDGYRGGSIAGAVVCYTPERIDAAVQHVRESGDGVFDSARKVMYVDALRSELNCLNCLLIRLERLSSQAV